MIWKIQRDIVNLLLNFYIGLSITSKYSFLVSIIFDMAASAKAVDILPGRETTPELTGSAALIRTLTVSTYALDTPQTLTMTALTSVHSQDLPGSPGGGLLP